MDDEDGENTEDFTARLEPDGSLPGGVTLAPDTASVSINDNEGNDTDSKGNIISSSYIKTTHNGVCFTCVCVCVCTILGLQFHL